MECLLVVLRAVEECVVLVVLGVLRFLAVFAVRTLHAAHTGMVVQAVIDLH
jgi:hypothetical protein